MTKKVKLSNVLDIVRGISYSTPELTNENEGMPLYNLKSIKKNGSVTENNFKYYSGKLRERDHVVVGDILIALTDLTPTSEIIGFPVYINSDIQAGFSADLGKLILKTDKFLPKYIYYALRTEIYRRHIIRYSNGANVKHLNVNGVYEFYIPDVSTSEQKQIISIMEKVEDLKRKREDANEKLNILVLAVFAQMFGNPVTNSMGWPTKKVANICDLVRGSSPRPQGDRRYFDGPIPRLMIADVTRDGMYVTPRIDSLTEEGARRSRPMKAGSVVMAVSAAIGLPSILAIDACIHDGFVGFRDLDENILPIYFYFFLLFRQETSNQKGEGAVFRNITTVDIKRWSVPVPPKDKQEQFVSTVNDIYKIKERQKLAGLKIDSLLISLQVKNFTI